MVDGRDMDTRKRSDTVRKRLEKAYGRPINDNPSDPLSALVHTILSQNTTDVTSERAWKALRRSYRSWRSLANASPQELAETIRVSGLSRLKAERILGALADIERLTGKLSLDFLRDMSEEAVDGWLSQLKGVGPKTRAIILLFSLRKKAFPVDTHIFRVAKRLGFVRQVASREEIQKMMASLVRPSDYYSYHINLIEHGRAVCSARVPRCFSCVLSDICPWSEKKKYVRESNSKVKAK